MRGPRRPCLHHRGRCSTPCAAESCSWISGPPGVRHAGVHFPWMNDLQQRHGARGLAVIAVNVDRERALADAFLRDLPAAFRLEFDAGGERRAPVRGPGNADQLPDRSPRPAARTPCRLSRRAARRPRTTDHAADGGIRIDDSHTTDPDRICWRRCSLTGCASLGVQPWERDLHSRVDMQPDELDAGIDDHIYFSKEASSGGRGFAGGGCGCN